MADSKNNKKMVEAITSMDEDFTQWYTDVCIKADLIAYSHIKGFMVIKPYGYALWENMQALLDKRFKKTGVQNVYMPLLIPESLLAKEGELVNGFAPEVAWVTAGGTEPLQERLAIRPTSETVFSDFYKDDVHSYRDLPRLYNQWCSVVRWEKETRPFLRSREFLWQEGHTIHASKEEAEERTQMMLNLYADFLAEDMAIPTIKGQKTEKEKFAGADATYTVEALMHDCRALQSGTSHFFGQKFSKAYDITYTDKDNQLKYVWQTSWGVTTRMIGAMIMVHGDNSGLVIPPRIAPIQVAVIPIMQKKEGVLDCAQKIYESLNDFRVKLDDTDRSPGFKFSEQEMRGIPLRVEIGPKDMEQGKCVLVRRDTREKIECPIDEVASKVSEVLVQIQNDMLASAKAHLEAHTFAARNKEEFEDAFKETKGFVKAMWCGDRACEDKIKEDYNVTSRCMPFKQEEISGTCVCCGKPAKKMVIWGRAY
ncbi:proline--tRNA ligase [Butyrivibrio sp. NC3005]|uniref:proline--tRNA ligase n=1 Tax=Butyrivibrio sp. NC3005 TaxID=1280685 RepID=UPI000411D2A8|nr:proline--tRNA ligase [Butyrivibrio sp. NC3005]